MRPLVLAFTLAAAGCAAQGLPIEGGGSSVSGTVDMARPLVAVGGKCSNACDCQDGLACRLGICEVGSGPVYCCMRACGVGDVCQNLDGTFSMCPNAGPPPKDAGIDAEPDGGPGWCIKIPCKDHSTCASLGCGFCGGTGTCWVDP